MTVGLSSYILSALALAVVIASLGFTALRIRQRLLPTWRDTPARLVEAVIGVALLVWLCELLGTVGLLYDWLLIAWSLLAAALAAFLSASRTVGEEGDAASAPEQRHPAAVRSDPGPWAIAVTVAVIAVVFAHWGLFAKQALDYGVSNFDSLWSHLPFAAGIAQSHSVTALHYTNTAFTNLNWFYPLNSELPHAVGILLTDRDTLSLFVNFGWLALAFLAAWCIGRPYGRGHLSVIAAAVVLDSDTLVVRVPGSAKDDVMAVALLLAAIAIVITAWAERRTERGAAPSSLPVGWPLAVAGLAAGLAVGTKVTVTAMVAGLTLAVIILAPAGRRRAAAAWWFLPALAGGGYWYLRNLIAIGNPLPQVSGLGPIPLPHPQQVQRAWPDFSVLHYATDTAVWRDYFGPGLELAFGSLWPLVIGGALVGGSLALFWSGDRILRWVGGVTLFGAVAYLATPLSAPGPEGTPFQFWINVRYALPALITGLVLLPLTKGFERPQPQWALVAGLLIVFLLTNDPEAVLHDPGGGFGLLLAIVAVLIPTALLLSRRWGGTGRALGVEFALLALLVVAIGYPLQRHYLGERFGPDSGIPGMDLSSAYVWARGIQDSRIGLAGTTAGFYQYGFYGADLSNNVRYLGEKGPQGAYNPIPDCRSFRAAVDDARLDYLITSPFLNFADSSAPLTSPESGWLNGSPAVEAIQRSGPVTVWRVRGRLAETVCGAANEPLHYVPQQPS